MVTKKTLIFKATPTATPTQTRTTPIKDQIDGHRYNNNRYNNRQQTLAPQHNNILIKIQKIQM